MGKNLNEINPELKPGDRIIIIYMDGESSETGLEFGSTKGKVIEKINQPKFTPSDPGYGYKVEWYDNDGKVISTLPILPEADAWLFDKEYYKSNTEKLDENMFRDIESMMDWGEFLQVFNKQDLEDVCEMFELERRSGLSNMYTEGGRFLLTGPEFIKDFIKLKSHETNFDKEDKKIHKSIISRSQKVRDIFIRNAMKYLELIKKDQSTKQIQSTMQTLARMAKRFWMQNANKYLNKEIK